MGICLFNDQQDLSVEHPGDTKCLKQSNLGAEEIIICKRKYWEGQGMQMKAGQDRFNATG